MRKDSVYAQISLFYNKVSKNIVKQGKIIAIAILLIGTVLFGILFYQLDLLNNNLSTIGNKIESPYSQHILVHDTIYRDECRHTQALTPRPDPNKHEMPVILKFPLLSISLLLLCIAIMLPKGNKRYAAATFSALFALGSIVKFTLENKNEMEVAPTINLDFSKHWISKGKPSGKEYKGNVRIGSFLAGDTILTDAGKNQLESLKVSLSKTNVTEVYISGGVDKRQLKRNALKTFGDNLTLAQARANAVRNYLNNNLYSGTATFVHIGVNGANDYNSGIDTASYHLSRVVNVHWR